MNIVVRCPQSGPRVQFCQEPSRGLSHRLVLSVCAVSEGPFHVVRSSMEPASRWVHGHPRVHPAAAPRWSSIHHGAHQNVLRDRPQNFATRHGRLLPVRPACLPNINRGASRRRGRSYGFDLREMDQRPDQAVCGSSCGDDHGLRPGVSGRGHSINPPVGGADHRARQAC